MQLIPSGAEFQTRSVGVEITLRWFFPLSRHFLFCPHLEQHRITHRNLLVLFLALRTKEVEPWC